MNAFARTSRLSLAILMLMLLSLGSSFAHHLLLQPGPWELLGSRKVNFAVDRDEIFVTAREGSFTALQLKVKGAPIDLTRVVVHFRNGQEEVLEVRERIPAGGQTRVLDLPGNRRVITKVVFVYDTRNRARQRATVELWGRQ